MKAKTSHVFLSFFVLLIPYLLPAQQLIFSKLYNDPVGRIEATTIIRTLDNGFLVAGSTQGQGLVFKIDSIGNLLWSKTIHTMGYESFKSVIATNDSCFLLAGTCFLNSGSGNTDILCVKINSNGDTLWSKAVNGMNNSQPLSIHQTLDHGFIITGQIYGTPSKICVVKIDSTGNFEWMKNISAGNHDNIGCSVKQTPDSGFIIIGYAEDYPPLSGYTILLKLSSTGSVSWIKKYINSIPVFTFGKDLQITTNGFLCLINVDDGIALMKTDFNGVVLWSKSYIGFLNANCINCWSDKFITTSDSCFAFVSGNCTGSFYKVDSIGNLVWAQELEFVPFDIALSNDGGFVIVGGPDCVLKTTSSAHDQIGIIKTDSLGNGTNCSNPDTNINVVVDTLIGTATSFNVSNTGSSYLISPVSDSLAIALDSGCVYVTGGIKENTFEIGFTIYPNPALNEINISFQNISGICNLSIINLFGQEIYSTTIEKSQLQNYTITQTFPKGYFAVIIKNKEGLTSRKLIIQ